MRYRYISLYRVSAMCCILACHIAQAKGMQIAYLLNGAVYAFLLISGVLLGNKEIKSGCKIFYFKRLTRILIPYYGLLFVYFVLYMVTGQTIGNGILSNVLCLQWFVPGLYKTGHLWYISCILICYLLTPILQKLIEKIQLRKITYWFIMIGVAMLSLILSRGPINVLFLFVFLLGYTYTRLYRKLDSTEMDQYEIAILSLGYILIVGRLVVEYILGRTLPNLLGDVAEIVCAFSMFLSLKYVMQIRESSILDKFGGGILEYLDSISYEIYLTHHLFILGILSVMDLTAYPIFNIIIALLLTVVSAQILHTVSSKVTSIINTEEKRKS